MNKQLQALALLRDGVIIRSEALEVVPDWVFDHAVRAGHLTRLFPRVYADSSALQGEAGLQGEAALRRRAAVRYAGGVAALSHTSALAVWGLPTCDATVHLTTDEAHRLRGGSGLAVHRRAGFRLGPPDTWRRDGLPVTRLERAIVDAWPLAAGDAQRAPLIRAVNSRMTTPARVSREVDRAVRLRGRAELRRLLGLLEAGCHSELEIWGYEHVFQGPRMPAFRWQVPVALGSRTVYLDVYAETERVNFELDGAEWHATPAQRERDLRRDAALAAMGIVVVRFTHRRLTRDPDGVRQAVLAILSARRAA